MLGYTFHYQLTKLTGNTVTLVAFQDAKWEANLVTLDVELWNSRGSCNPEQLLALNENISGKFAGYLQDTIHGSIIMNVCLNANSTDSQRVASEGLQPLIAVLNLPQFRALNVNILGCGAFAFSCWTDALQNHPLSNQRQPIIEGLR